MNNKPEEFCNKPTEQMAQQYHLIDYKEIDVKKLIKSVSLATSATVFGIGILVKFADFLKNVKFAIPPITVVWPKISISFEQGVIAIGILSLIPYLTITLYDHFNKDEDETKKEVKDVRKNGR